VIDGELFGDDAGSPDFWGWRKTRRKSGGRVVENTVSLFDALQGLEMARKYIQMFDVDIWHTNAMPYTWKQALHIEASRQMETKNNIGLVKKWTLLPGLCKWVLFNELYFKQLCKKWVLLFGKFAKN
jgi:hypothetical protein